MKVSKFKVLLYLKKSNLDKQGKAPIMGRIHARQRRVDDGGRDSRYAFCFISHRVSHDTLYIIKVSRTKRTITAHSVCFPIIRTGT